MASTLAETIVLYSVGNVIYAKDRLLQNDLWNLDIGMAAYDMLFDTQRGNLWIFSNSKVIRCYEVAVDGLTIIQEWSVPYDSYSMSKVLDKNTGILYVVNPIRNSDNIIYRIDPNFNAYTFLALPIMNIDTSNAGLGLGYSNDSRIEPCSLVIDPVTNVLLITFNSYNLTGTSSAIGHHFTETVQSMKIDLLLQGYEIRKYDDFSGFRQCNYYRFYIAQYSYYSYIPSNYKQFTNDSVYVSSTGKIVRFYDRALNPLSESSVIQRFQIEEFDSTQRSMRKVQPEDLIGDIPTSYVLKVWEDVNTKEIMVLTEDKNVYAINPQLTTCDLRYSISNTTQNSFNEITGEIYSVNSNGDAIILTTTDASTLLTSEPVSTSMLCMEVCEIEETFIPNNIIPSRIVFPAVGSSTLDTTPTIIFKVGASHPGWTQQFRICADRDENVLLENDYTYSYERVFDSWLNGDNYRDLGWETGTDYVVTEIGDNGDTATWTSLGSDDGLQETGTSPTNGVSCEAGDDVYVRFTIPSDGILTGADSNTRWYFKIYSYSRSV